MAENTVTSKDIERQEVAANRNNCLKCVKWNDSRGLEVLYQEGIYPAMLQVESVMASIRNLILIRQLHIAVSYLTAVGDAITSFEIELGIIEETED